MLQYQHSSKCWKVDFLINYINEKFKWYYDCQEHVVIDEGIIPWRGRYCSFKQNIKRKPHSTGFLKKYKLINW